MKIDIFSFSLHFISSVSADDGVMAFEETECSCLDKPMLCNILTDLSSKSEAYFGSEQRGDIALSLDQKSSYAHSVLHKSKEKFVTQYGKFFTVDQFSYFTKNFGGKSV